MKTNIAIVGAAGRMGNALVRCVNDAGFKDLQLVAAVERRDHPDVGKDAGVLAGIGDIGMPVGGDLQAAANACDVLIDFSFHTATADHARQAATWGRRLVIGTTGLSDDEQAAVKEAARDVAIVMAPNMSLGVNLLFSLVEQAARALKGKGFDMEIIERHHRRKKDAPSGTALGLGHAAAKGAELDLEAVAVHGREGISASERPVDQIGFHAIRGGDIVGDHTVLFAADGECVELNHRATSRDAFAFGALRAAAWIAGRDPGLYSMRDVLGL